MGKGMTDKQKMFADEYLIDLNATRAYKAVYKNCKKDAVAAAAASRMLRNVKVQKYIDEELEKIQSAKVATVQEVMEYLTSVLRGQSTSEVIVVEGEGDGYSTAKVIDKHPDENNKLKAAELLGRRYGMWKEKIELEGIEQEKSKLDNLIAQIGGGNE